MTDGRRGDTGIGGWLAFFVVTLGLGAALSVSAMAYQLWYASHALSPGLRDYAIVAAILAGVRAAATGYCVWRLHARRDRRTPRIVIAILWLLVLAPPAVLMLAALALLDRSSATALLSFATFRPAVNAALWTMYLRRSERVANTYGSGTQADLAAVFR